MSSIRVVEHCSPAVVVDLEQLDASRREAVKLCGEKGEELFSSLLASATFYGDQVRVAIVSFRSQHDMAERLGWGRDTLMRYLAILQALHLVDCLSVADQEMALHIPLCPYVPLTSFAELDALMIMRSKQRQLAMNVKERYIARFGHPTSIHANFIHKKLKHIRSEMGLGPIQWLRWSVLLMEFAVSLIRFGQAHPHDTDFGGYLMVPQESDESSEDNLDDLLIPVSQDVEMQGDRPSLVALPVSQEGEMQGDRPSLSVLPVSQDMEMQGDRPSLVALPVAQKPGIQGDQSVANELKQGDIEQSEGKKVVLDDLLTYNVTYLIDSITSDTVKRKRAAQFLGRALENNSNHFAAYLKLFKEFTPEVIGRAYLATMVLIHQYHWTIHRPGAFFTAQCRALSGQDELKKYTLADVEEWLRLWGEIPYRDLITSLSAFTGQQSALPKPAGLMSSSQAGSGLRVVHGSALYPGKPKRTYGSLLPRIPTAESRKKYCQSVESFLPTGRDQP